MNAQELAAYIKEEREQDAAIADSQLLVSEAIRQHDEYSANRDFFEKVIDIVESLCQTGSFKKQVTLENGRQAVYRFSWAVGMGHSRTTGEYARMFGKPVPEWVMRRPPYHIHRLCALAIEQHQKLPTLRADIFSPQNAEWLRELKVESDGLLAAGIRQAYNRGWLESVAGQLADAVDPMQAAADAYEASALRLSMAEDKRRAALSKESTTPANNETKEVK